MAGTVNDKMHKVPKFLHAQPQIMWFELDEIMILVIFTLIGISLNRAWLFAPVGFAIMKLYGKMKNSKQEGFLKHFAYWHGLYNVKGKFPESWKRELLY